MRESINRTGLVLFSAIVLLFLAAIAVFAPINSAYANAANEVVMSVTQTDKVMYSGKVHVRDGKFYDYDETVQGVQNKLFSALTFAIDGQKIPVQAEDVTFTDVGTELHKPDDYICNLSVLHSGKSYLVRVNLTISKAKLLVKALINGEKKVTLKEGDSYTTQIVYEGFVNGETVDVLDSPALIQREPKLPTFGFVLVPEFASSSLYEIEYEGATLIIFANPDHEKVYMSGDELLVVLSGSYSPFYEFRFSDVGVNKADPIYVAMNDKFERYYIGTRITEKYEQRGAYRLNLYLDGNLAELTTTSTIKIKLPAKLRGKSEYLLMHFDENGKNESILGKEVNGYLQFDSVTFGDFLLFTPIEGANKVVILAVCVGLFAFVILATVFFAMFRRKY